MKRVTNTTMSFMKMSGLNCKAFISI